MLLSLFCGAGGLDLGFEQAGFKVGLALDRKQDSVASYNLNRPRTPTAKVQDLRDITLNRLDELYGKRFLPTAVIGGPPCQSFSQANVNQRIDDVRSSLPQSYAILVCELHKRNPLDFFVMENVVGLTLKKHKQTLNAVESKLKDAGFRVARLILNAKEYGTPQNRPRLFLIGINANKFSIDPESLVFIKRAGGNVRSAIGGLPEPAFFKHGINMSTHPVHFNHWCMMPRSPKFYQEGGVKPDVKGRSFKVLRWESESDAVAYGHREVHVHPDGKRRLSVYEAMLLQGFPATYRLLGTLSSQIDQVSEAVPPPLARTVAGAIKRKLYPQRIKIQLKSFLQPVKAAERVNLSSSSFAQIS